MDGPTVRWLLTFDAVVVDVDVVVDDDDDDALTSTTSPLQKHDKKQGAFGHISA